MRALVPVILVAAAAAAGACKRPAMATAAECDQLLQHFIDMKVAEDPRGKGASDAGKAELRIQISREILSDPDVRQVQTQCQTEVTQDEFDCASHATTARAWNDCIQ
ncbi:MAG TPA: hypothetical protein VF765_32195 [Polyangiaceae bacterium]